MKIKMIRRMSESAHNWGTYVADDEVLAEIRYYLGSVSFKAFKLDFEAGRFNKYLSSFRRVFRASPEEAILTLASIIGDLNDEGWGYEDYTPIESIKATTLAKRGVPAAYLRELDNPEIVRLKEKSGGFIDIMMNVDGSAWVVVDDDYIEELIEAAEEEGLT